MGSMDLVDLIVKLGPEFFPLIAVIALWVKLQKIDEIRGKETSAYQELLEKIATQVGHNTSALERFSKWLDRNGSSEP